MPRRRRVSKESSPFLRRERFRTIEGREVITKIIYELICSFNRRPGYLGSETKPHSLHVRFETDPIQSCWTRAEMKREREGNDQHRVSLRVGQYPKKREGKTKRRRTNIDQGLELTSQIRNVEALLVDDVRTFRVSCWRLAVPLQRVWKSSVEAKVRNSSREAGRRRQERERERTDSSDRSYPLNDESDGISESAGVVWCVSWKTFRQRGGQFERRERGKGGRGKATNLEA